MLSRRSSAAGAAADRSGVGERLQAALAGLQELHLLRDRQGDMVSWALRLDREEPVSSVPSEPQGAGLAGMGAEEQRLEATLTSLKQQLSRLRKQDVGLKSHLQQLDQQIHELKLDVSKASTEQLESDSRPSSGFYELSDGGSCSRSNSCTSVYSECLSSSQTSLVPASPSSCQVSPPPQVDVCRRRSADESQPTLLRATGLHLGCSRIRAWAAGAEHTRPRPVSTGDLDKMMTQGLGSFKSADAKKRLMCPKQTTSLMEPKLQQGLESPSRTEEYQYPSPLHAVTLQSQVCLGGSEAQKSVHLEGRGAPDNKYDSFQMESRTLSYIDKILQRSLSRFQKETGTMKSEDRYDMKSTGNVQEVSQTCASVQPPPPLSQASTDDVVPPNGDQKRQCSGQEPAHEMNQNLGAADGLSRYPAATQDYRSDEVTCSSLKKNDKARGETAKVTRSYSENKCNLEPREMKQNLGVTQSFDVLTGSPELVRAMFVPARSQRVKTRQADRKTKAVKLRPRSGVKSRATKQQHGFSGENTSAEVKWELRKPGKGKTINRATACHELQPRSGFVSVLNGPGLVSHKVQPKASSVPAFAKLGKSCGPRCLEYEHPAERGRRRQASKWQSDVDVCHASHVQRSKDCRVQASESFQMVCSIGAKSGQWTGPQQSFQVPVFSGSFLHTLNSSYPPAPAHASGPYTPRCESEYSAECPSLFHSTIAESSEGEASDHTANRFGDGESGQSLRCCSDSDSSLSPEEGEIHKQERGLVWAEASLVPAAAERAPQQRPPRHEPSTCRIKASRALKKKIRRFQPASLKVMTLV